MTQKHNIRANKMKSNKPNNWKKKFFKKKSRKNLTSSTKKKDGTIDQVEIMRLIENCYKGSKAYYILKLFEEKQLYKKCGEQTKSKSM